MNFQRPGSPFFALSATKLNHRNAVNLHAKSTIQVAWVWKPASGNAVNPYLGGDGSMPAAAISESLLCGYDKEISSEDFSAAVML